MIYFFDLGCQVFHIFIQLFESLGSSKNFFTLLIGGFDGIADRIDYHVGIDIQLVGNLGDLFGKALGLLCELTDLLCYNGETASGFTGTGTFDGSVQCQKIGLTGDCHNTSGDFFHFFCLFL